MFVLIFSAQKINVSKTRLWRKRRDYLFTSTERPRWTEYSRKARQTFCPDTLSSSDRFTRILSRAAPPRARANMMLAGVQVVEKDSVQYRAQESREPALEPQVSVLSRAPDPQLPQVAVPLRASNPQDGRTPEDSGFSRAPNRTPVDINFANITCTVKLGITKGKCLVYLVNFGLFLLSCRLARKEDVLVLLVINSLCQL